jgi:glutamate/tyrosine decarboxylase-like PLP-dependent enzyme
MPSVGTDWKSLKAQLESFKAGDVNWKDGRLGVYVFHAGHDVMDVGKDAYHLYQTENGLGGGTAFPSLKKMESEVVAMGLGLLNGPDGACGDMTSGGSESIFMAVKSCRDQAKAQGKDVVGAELVIPYSAHPAFDKAAGFLGLVVNRIPLQDNHLADVKAMSDAITDRTIMFPTPEMLALMYQHLIFPCLVSVQCPRICTSTDLRPKQHQRYSTRVRNSMLTRSLTSKGGLQGA